MVKRFLALLALIASPAFGQVTPPDIVGTNTTPVTATYAAGTTANVLGTGTPPATTAQLADVASASLTGWLGTSVSYCDIGVAGTGAHGCANGYVAAEQKMRFTLDGSIHVLYDDPIRNYGQQGASHCHSFFGNRTANAYSTYAALRGRPSSDSAGGIANGTAYWFPCLIKTNPFGDGKNYAIKPDTILGYYLCTEGPCVRIPRGLRYVTGFNMDDPTGSAVSAEIAAANAQPGTAGRYSVAPGWSITQNGFAGWFCESTGEKVASLRTAGGGDPFTTTCPSSSKIYLEIDGASCWNGQNLWVAGGYNHLRRKIWDGVYNKAVCPNGWYEVPEIVLKIFFTHSGAADYTTWKLSSDTMISGALPGTTFHTDWFGAWDDTIFLGWQRFCNGVDGYTPHECNASTVSATQTLITGEVPPDGYRSAQVRNSLSWGTASAANMKLLPASPGSSATLHVHGN